ncbi:hypothetical protein KC345_g3348 [Hortaea werneckii]|nr:hypothetical protein KC345_g3348 [Hortaea werneckii]
MSNPMRILIVEDEQHLAEALTQILKKHNYSVDAVHDGRSGLDYAQSGIYDLLLLDIMMPEMDGISVLKELRKDGISTPVIMLTAKGEINDMVTGLDYGADDYIAKPFSSEELLARIRAALRRKGEVIPDDALKFGDIELNTSNPKLTVKGKEIKLNLKETELLELLILRKQAVTSKEQIIEKLWGFDSEAEHNNVEVYISFLRKKLTFLNSGVRISTIRGVGNRFLIINLATISVMMLIAFASIYVINYLNVQSDINMDLHRIADYQQKGPGDANGPRGSGDGGTMPMDKGPIDNGTQPPDRSISFTIQTDASGTLIDKQSKFTMDDEFYTAALKEALSIGKDIGRFTLDDSKWIFTVKHTSAGELIVFLDITAQQKILTNLIYIFTVVGLLMLIILYFTSRFFANRSIAPVREAFDKQKQFIADASHELKTPLTIINTNADVLLSNSDDTIRNQAKWLQYIKSETERMTRLTNDLLYLTEMDDSRTGMIHSKFNMSDAVENIILTMEAVIFEKNISFGYDIQPELTVIGNSEQIKQVVMILLDNAVKYTNPKGAVHISLKKQNNDVLLSVSNTGEGIAAEHLTRIFDRFYRTDSSRARKQGGYGLGLAIAKSIVDQHKGKIYAKSVAGESTTFHVQLP